MFPLLRRAFATLRVWLGFADQSVDRLTPAHGWLLPPAATSLSRVIARASVPSVREASSR
jgi:hypothetical protein